MIAGGVVTALLLVVAVIVVSGTGDRPGHWSAPSRTPVTTPPVGPEPSGSPGPSGASPGASAAPDGPGQSLPERSAISEWVYQLQGYPERGIEPLARTRSQLAVIDLAKDAASDFFGPEDLAVLHRSGKRVLAYFEIGSIENFRPEYPALRRGAGDLIANRWEDWPNEYFVRYWDQRWWDQVVRPRVDRALRAGFDGVYLDTPLAYEEIDPQYAQGRDRQALGRAMVDLIMRISAYAKARNPDFWIVPQNSPELRRFTGYAAAIDGIGMEELFYRATDQSCDEDWCRENLADARALRDAGKLVLAVDYASRSDNRHSACARYSAEHFAGYVADRELDRVETSCG